MKSSFLSSPRTFEVGGRSIRDVGKIELEPEEMVTFIVEPGHECDLTAATWGFYLGSSLNGRMRSQGYRVALVVNPQGKLFVNAVLEERLAEFEEYLRKEASRVVAWLDRFDESGSGRPCAE